MSTGEASTSTSPPTPAPTAERWVAVDTDISHPYLLTNENYAIWRMQAEIHLQAADVWEVVCGSESKPITDPHDNWERKDTHARSLLLQMVSEEFISPICDAETTHDAWVDLDELLNRKDIASVMRLVNALLDLKKDESRTWVAHVIDFESRWSAINLKVNDADSASEAWRQGLKLCFSDQEFKAQILLRTVPPELENVVDVLRMKDDLTYADVRNTLLDLNSKTQAYGVRRSQKGVGG